MPKRCKVQGTVMSEEETGGLRDGETERGIVFTQPPQSSFFKLNSIPVSPQNLVIHRILTGTCKEKEQESDQVQQRKLLTAKRI